MLLDGKSVPEGYTEGIKWIRKAADQGHADGQSMLGQTCSNGKGVPPDYVVASEVFWPSGISG